MKRVPIHRMRILLPLLAFCLAWGPALWAQSSEYSGPVNATIIGIPDNGTAPGEPSRFVSGEGANATQPAMSVPPDQAPFYQGVEIYEGEGWEPLIDRLVRDGFAEKDVRALFSRPTAKYDPQPMRTKIQGLYKSNFSSGRILAIQKALHEKDYLQDTRDGLYGENTCAAITAFQRDSGLRVDGTPSAFLKDFLAQSGKKPKVSKKEAANVPSGQGPVYSGVFKPVRLAESREFFIENRSLLRRVEQEFGVPPEVAVGLLTVETRVGKYLGTAKAFNTLASMAVAKDFSRVEPFFQGKSLHPAQVAWIRERSGEKADWAYGELKALLRYAESNNLDPLGFPGSIYGAIGISQFMPSNVLRFGLDGNKDGVVDLFNREDALFSMANYLVQHGWKGDMKDRGKRHGVLYRYNHSSRYANTILAVADHLAEGWANATISEGNTLLRVENAEELFAAVAPDTTIVLAPGRYDLFRAKPPGPDNPHVAWKQCGAGWRPVFQDARNLVLSGEGRVEFSFSLEQDAALDLERCDGFVLDNVIFQGPEQGAGSVALLSVRESGGVAIQDCMLRGPAATGLVLENVKQCLVVNSGITGCGEAAVEILDSREVEFSNFLFRENTGNSLIRIMASEQVGFRRGVVLANAASGEKSYMVAIDEHSKNVAIQETYFAHNMQKALAEIKERVEIKDCVFTNNRFSR